MKRAQYLIAILLLAAFASADAGVWAQGTTRRRRPAPSPSQTNRNAPSLPAPDVRLTGLYRLDAANSDDPRRAAEGAARNDPFGQQEQFLANLTARLSSPEQLAVERRGNQISIASNRAPRLSFEADGRERTELSADGHQIRTRAALNESELIVTTYGSQDREDEFSVTFASIDNGRRLRVTRRIFAAQLERPVVVQSLYDKVSSTARFDIYGQPESPRPTTTARNNTTPRGNTQTARNNTQGTTSPPAGRTRPQPTPPVIRNRPPQPQPPADAGRTNGDANALVIPAGAQFVAVLNNDLTTERAREGDNFTLTVRAPAQFAGATIEGYVARAERAGPFTGRAELSLAFRSIRLPDGRTAAFEGTVEAVRPAGGEGARVDPESGGSGGSVQESDSQSRRTAERAAIGAGIGAIIGAITGGGRGAAIGAAIGAGAGAGSVYAQGRDDLELRSGTELTVTTNRPR